MNKAIKRNNIETDYPWRISLSILELKKTGVIRKPCFVLNMSQLVEEPINEVNSPSKVKAKS